MLAAIVTEFRCVRPNASVSIGPTWLNFSNKWIDWSKSDWFVGGVVAVDGERGGGRPGAVPSGAGDFIWALAIGLACLLFKLPFVQTYLPGWLWKGISIFGPLLVIIGFWVHGHGKGRTRHADGRQRFADNVYFLGFIFTMGSLIMAFLPVALTDSDIRAQDVYYAFGTALLATAFGLIGRVIITQTGATAEEIAARVEEDLTALAAGVSEEAERILARLAEARDALGRQSEEVVKAVFAETGPRMRALAGDFDTAAQSVSSRLSTLTAETDAAIEALRARLEARTGDMEAAAALLAGTRQQMADALDQLRAPAEQLGTDLSAVSAASQAAIAGLRADVAALGQALEAAGSTGARFEAAVDTLGQRLDALGTRMDAAVGGVEARATAAAERVEVAADGFRSDVRTASADADRAASEATAFRDAITGAIGTFDQAVDRFTRQVERIGRADAAPPEPAPAGTAPADAGVAR